MANIYPIINGVPHECKLTDENELQKVRVNSLLKEENHMEFDLKRIRKCKKKWNILSNILHYSKYGIEVVTISSGAILLFFPLSMPVGIILIGISVVEVVGLNVLEDSLVKSEVNKYKTKSNKLHDLIEKIHFFKRDAMKDGILSEKEMDHFNAILNEYESNKKKERDIPIKENPKNLEKEFSEMKVLMQTLLKKNGT